MSTPTWFTDAIATPYDLSDVTVAGARVRYRAWGKPGQQAVILVHGGAAHAGWWDHIAPFLSAEHRVVSVDLSGHGDSDHRDQYSLEMWADEVLAVGAKESTGRPVIAGHSMGGFVGLTAAKLHGETLRGVVAIDSPVRERSPEAKAWLASNPSMPAPRLHPDRESIVKRFRTLPEDEAGLGYIRDHIAEQSVREVDGGWRWAFDPNIFLRAQMEPEDLAEAECEVALVRGERGMATTDITSSVAEILGGHVPVTLVPDAGHHIMFDQPIALIALLQALVGQWRTP